MGLASSGDTAGTAPAQPPSSGTHLAPGLPADSPGQGHSLSGPSAAQGPVWRVGLVVMPPAHQGGACLWHRAGSQAWTQSRQSPWGGSGEEEQRGHLTGWLWLRLSQYDNMGHWGWRDGEGTGRPRRPWPSIESGLRAGTDATALPHTDSQNVTTAGPKTLGPTLWKRRLRSKERGALFRSSQQLHRPTERKGPGPGCRAAAACGGVSHLAQPVPSLTVESARGTGLVGTWDPRRGPSEGENEEKPNPGPMNCSNSLSFSG